MFEDFSFSSPSSNRPDRLAVDGNDKVMMDYDSTMISPLSSRASSPSSMPNRSQSLSRPRSPVYRRPAPTSVPASYEMSQRRISVGMLTEKLNAHTLESAPVNTVRQYNHRIRAPISPVSPPLSVAEINTSVARSTSVNHNLLTPPGDYDDEGYCESTYRGSVRSLSTAYPTSVPSRHSPQDLRSVSQPLELLSAYQDERHGSVRLQRQRLSRAQCSVPTGVDAIRLALLIEENERRSMGSGTRAGDDCHPSALPPELSPRRKQSTLNRPPLKSRQPASGSGLASGSREPEMAMRRKSMSAASFSAASRVGKPRSHHSASARDIFLRKKNSDQTLRRDGLVCAALTSMMYETPVSDSEPHP